MVQPGQASFGGIVFDGGVIEYGFTLADLPDWYARTPPKNRSESRPRGHGSFRQGATFRHAKTWRVVGSFNGPSPAAAQAARQTLAAMQADGVASPFVFNDPDIGIRQCLARIVDGPAPDARVWSPHFGYEFQLEADDPRKYHLERTATAGPPVAGGGLLWNPTWPLVWEPGGSDGRLTVENPGTADTYASLHVTGGLADGFSLVEVGTGRELRFERPVPVGSTVTIDQRSGRATLDVDTNDVGAWLTRFDWFPVGPGQTQQILFTPLGATTGTPTLTARWRPADW